MTGEFEGMVAQLLMIPESAAKEGQNLVNALEKKMNVWHD